MKVHADTRFKAKPSRINNGDLLLVRQRKENKLSTLFDPSPLCVTTVQLNINFTHAYREHACVCTLMACNFVNYREYFNFARFGSVRSRATVHDNTLEYTLHE